MTSSAWWHRWFPVKLFPVSASEKVLKSCEAEIMTLAPWGDSFLWQSVAFSRLRSAAGTRRPPPQEVSGFWPGLDLVPPRPPRRCGAEICCSVWTWYFRGAGVWQRLGSGRDERDDHSPLTAWSRAPAGLETHQITATAAAILSLWLLHSKLLRGRRPKRRRIRRRAALWVQTQAEEKTTDTIMSVCVFIQSRFTVCFLAAWVTVTVRSAVASMDDKAADVTSCLRPLTDFLRF